MPKIKTSKNIGAWFPYKLNATLTQLKDNLVTCHALNRRIINIDGVFGVSDKYWSYPIRYRPTADAYDYYYLPNSITTKTPSILHLATGMELLDLQIGTRLNIYDTN